MRTDDPYRQYCFHVEIDDVSVAAFQSVSGLDVEVQMTEYREGTDKGGVRKLPAFPRFGNNLVLSRGQTQVNSVFWDWFRQLSQGEIIRRDGSVDRLARSGRGWLHAGRVRRGDRCLSSEWQTRPCMA